MTQFRYPTFEEVKTLERAAAIARLASAGTARVKSLVRRRSQVLAAIARWLDGPAMKPGTDL
jgi:hypothetical protein